jgi:hypothetical protein
MTEVVIKNNKLYIIPMMIDESREIYLRRIDYIIHKRETTDIPINRIINMSYVWKNITVDKMVFSKDLDINL